MLLVNLYGAPGTGKSTGAAYIYSKLKLDEINCELVTEFAKDMVWDENKKAIYNQAYVFGNQYYRISRLENEVDVVITDSPILLSIIYNKDKRLGKEFIDLVKSVSSSYKNRLDILFKRVKQYKTVGRLHNEEQSDKLYNEIKDLLDIVNPEYEIVEATQDGYEKVIEMIKEKLH